MYQSLTGFEKQFVSEYLSNGRSATQAVKACRTYKTENSARSMGSRMLKRPSCADFIHSVDTMEVVDSIMSRREAMERLTKIARSNITDVAQMTGVGPQIKTDADFENVDEVTATAYGIKIKMRSVEAAIKQLSVLGGWEAAYKHDNSKGGENIVLDNTELAKSLLFVLQRGVRELPQPESEK